MRFNAAWSIADNLATAQVEKAKVSVHLRGGATLSGLVEAVGDQHVVLTQLAGREFYDALVRLEEIAAVEVRGRG